MAGRLDVRAVLRVAREVRRSLPEPRPVQVSGALADVLAKELGRGGAPGHRNPGMRTAS